MRNRSWRFDGATEYTDTPASLADGKLGTFFMVFRPDVVNITQNIMRNSDGVESSAGGKVICFAQSTLFKLQLFASDLTQLVSFNSGGVLVADTWHYVLASWDTGNDVAEMYIDDASVNSPAVVDGTIDYTRAAYHWGALKDSGFFGGNIATVLFDTERTIDITSAANRRKFYALNFTLADLGFDGSTPLGGQPAYYIQAPHGTTGPQNFGTQGDLSLRVGTLFAGPGPTSYDIALGMDDG